MWSDLSRLVDMLSVKYLSKFDSSFVQAGRNCWWRTETMHDLFRLVDSECK